MHNVSVIVPVYNAEVHLSRCIGSILTQSFTGFELILVDDGSTDGSGLICDEYAEKDTRVRVIHQNNAGAAAARNTGIEAATGKYLAFCDSDDVVSPMWLERLFALADEKTLPIGAYTHQSGELGKQKDLDVIPGKRYPRSAYYTFNRVGLAGYLCNALYRRDVVEAHGLRLRTQKDAGDYNEDLLFALTYVKYVDNIAYTGYADYLYDVHDDSLSRGNTTNYFDKYAEKFRLWVDFIQHESDDPTGELRQFSATMLYHFLQALRLNCQSIRKIKDIVYSGELQSSIAQADTSRESPLEVNLIRKKRVFTLYLFYQLLRIKRSQTS